jgi:hypothetical protein
MTDGSRIVTVPRNNPIDPITMGTIIRAAGMSIEEFRKLLWKSEIGGVSRSGSSQRGCP